MRKLLWLALLLYDVVSSSRPSNYDYDDVASDMVKRHSMLDEKRNWRRKTFAKADMEVRDWDDRRRNEYDRGRYLDELDKSYAQERARDREREREPEMSYRRRYEDIDKLNLALGVGAKSTEMSHPKYPETQHTPAEPEKKQPLLLNCDRPHERYEPCFAGCASVSCDNPRDRLKPCYPFCEPGCVCMPPYIRDDRTHKCVLPDDCTKGLKGIPDLGEEA